MTRDEALGDVVWELAKGLRSPEERERNAVPGYRISEAQELLGPLLARLNSAEAVCEAAQRVARGVDLCWCVSRSDDLDPCVFCALDDAVQTWHDLRGQPE